MNKKSFERIFSVRTVISFFMVIIMFLISVLRIAAINLNGYSDEFFSDNGISIELCKVRGSILDRNGIPITNSKMQNYAAIMPTDSAVSVISGTEKSEEKERVLSLLKSGKPAVTVLKEKTDCDGIEYIELPVRITENTVAHHIVGYLDGNGNGAYGIEAAYNSFLSSDNPVTAFFVTDGKRNPLLGIPPEFNGDTDVMSNAVYLTLDINIQKTVEKISEKMLSGAVVVSECKTNKIRAMVSLPDFLPNDISASLNEENSPLLNKCLEAYNVGSAFKPCIAAEAVKEGKDGTVSVCTGKRIIESRVFNCHNIKGHGAETLKTALRDSCNCYFYDLAISLGAKSVFKAAEYMGFGSKIKIADNIYTAKGNIPTEKELYSESSVANFGIGQGEIMLTPVSLLNMYSAIANNGEYYLPSIVEKTVSGGRETPYDIGKPTVAMSKKTASVLKEALRLVVTDGTGNTAYSKKVSSAGKTATAQTGRISQNGTEITNSWFCGFFPAESPKYTVVVMSDGNYEKSPAEVFKDICDALS